MEKKTVFVVFCNQSFANFACVVGVCSTREEAERYIDKHDKYPSTSIEEHVLDQIDPDWLKT